MTVRRPAVGAFAFLALFALACSPDEPAARTHDQAAAEQAFLRAMAEEAAATDVRPLVSAAPDLWVRVANQEPTRSANAAYEHGDPCFIREGRMVEMIGTDEAGAMMFRTLPTLSEPRGSSCPDGTLFTMIPPPED